MIAEVSFPDKNQGIVLYGTQIAYYDEGGRPKDEYKLQK